MESTDKPPADFECSLHFPLPICTERFNFFPITVEIKPRAKLIDFSGGEIDE